MTPPLRAKLVQEGIEIPFEIYPNLPENEAIRVEGRPVHPDLAALILKALRRVIGVGDNR